MNTPTRFGLACAAALMASASCAGIKASCTYPQNFSFSASTALIPLTTTGATSLTFNLNSVGKKILTFSAECSVNAPAGNSSAWIDIDILVNGVAVSPTLGSSDAFCGAHGTAGFGHWLRPSITVVIQGQAGANTVQVLGRLNAGAVGGWLSDSSIVIIDP